MVNQFLTLSLFIVLLSFFIILNSMASPDRSKAASALNSVSIAFSKQNKNELELSAQVESFSSSINEGSTIEKIEGLFDAQVPGIEIEKNRMGAQMTMLMEVRELEKFLAASRWYDPVRSNVSGSGTPETLIPLLVSLLNSPDDVQYSLDVMVHVPDNPALMHQEAPNVLRASTKVSGGFCDDVERLGLPPELVSCGVVRGQDDFVRLGIRRFVVAQAVSGGG